ncbi:putative quinol monooxygenase [Nocardiopsis metallicus]|uniref:Quinol monooxygenase YgiN n=1 Tax=Nocardiopsis metallicus TaxID=179819 RepID=A0A840VWY6_9ACTN|nr:putative quinol monooxygenase [Nocardiopsis metallicus]MBB5488869.1 quinol monooxygenase YgiN [Nocardiopsis metallicus]
MSSESASPYEVTARIRCTDPARATETRTALDVLVRKTRTEPGCLEFSAHEEAEAPGEFLLWEVFADEAAFREHFDHEHTRSYVARGLTEVVEHWVTRPVTATRPGQA